MKNSIGEFRKTDHFIFRQWDRSINDKLLTIILKKIPSNKKKTLLIISKRVLKKINKKINKELFIKVDGNVLITCFYCDISDYSNKNAKQEYLIINNIKL